MFSFSLSDFPSRKESVCVPKSNNSFSTVLEHVFGPPLIFLQVLGGVFIASIIRYVTFIPNSWGVLKKRSVDRSEKLRYRLYRRQHALQSCTGLSALSFESCGSSVGFGLTL